jgi:hypothetical protein
MALPSSGEISFSEINTELGQSSDAQLSLNDAAQGNVAAINTNSANTPDSSTPHSISEWYSYDHSASGGSVTEFSAGGPFDFIGDACETQDNSGTFYHDGGGSLPTVNDFVYEDEDGGNTVQSGIYFVNSGYILTVEFSGKVSSVGSCGR